MKIVAEGNYCVVMMTQEEAEGVRHSLRTGTRTPYADVLEDGLTDRLGLQTSTRTPAEEVAGESVSLESRPTEGVLEQRMAYLEARINDVDALHGTKLADVYEKINGLDERVWGMSDGMDQKVVNIALGQMRSMPAEWNGRCDLGEAFTRVVELVFRDAVEGRFFYDSMGNRNDTD